MTLQPSDHVTWVVREQEVGLHLETPPQARVESLVAPPPRSHAALTQIYRHHCDTTDAAREGMTSQERARVPFGSCLKQSSDDVIVHQICSWFGG